MIKRYRGVHYRNRPHRAGLRVLSGQILTLGVMNLIRDLWVAVLYTRTCALWSNLPIWWVKTMAFPGSLFAFFLWRRVSFHFSNYCPFISSALATFSNQTASFITGCLFLSRQSPCLRCAMFVLIHLGSMQSRIHAMLLVTASFLGCFFFFFKLK